MSDVPSSLQSWVSTIKTVVLTADAFQLFIKSVWCTTQLAQLSFKLSIGRTHSWRYKTFLACKVWTIQSVVFAADVFQLKKLKNVSCKYDRLNGWKKLKTPAASTTDWMVEAELCKLRGTSDMYVGRAYSMFHLKYVICELNLRHDYWYLV